ncbi:MAG TPA: hypothetical protein VGQ83_36710 [Polyangia bacterium]|jgi:hypothetical protein
MRAHSLTKLLLVAATMRTAVLLAGCAAAEGPGPADPGAAPPQGLGAPARAALPALLPALARQPAGGRVPVAGGGALRFIAADTFQFTGDVAAGTAAFDGAVVWDWMTRDQPAAFGTGAFALSVGGAAYAATGAESLALVVPDDATGQEYLLLAADVIDGASGAEVAQVLYVIVPVADFVPGAVVALDGIDRVALFAAGPALAEQPAVAAAAVSGLVTFGAGSLGAGGAVSASLTADFGPIDWPADPCASGCEPPPTTDPVNGIVPGHYVLAYAAPAYVFCEGSLAGHETDFAALTLDDAGFGGGEVDVTLPSPMRVALAGAALGAAFGAAALDLDWAGDPSFPGMFVGFALRDGAGPAGTTRNVAYLFFDGASATPTLVRGGAGLDFEDGAGGYCTTAFDATLTAP